MNQHSIAPVKGNDEIAAMCAMASRIWAEHYSEILDPNQISYMLEKFQSPRAVREQMEKDGYRYFWLRIDGQNAGYLAVQPKDGRLFLSKLYVEKRFRRNGLAAYAMNTLRRICRENGIPSVWLTVNRHNRDSIAAYRAMGFVKTQEQVTDIGGGYVMDDDIMELFVIQ